MNDLAGEIKRTLPAWDVFEHYGFRPNRSGFIQCPFHQGDRHGSLKVYDGDRGWHCFGCGAGGSVIDFVMRLFDLDFKGACLRLNEDFHLGLSSQRPTRAELSALVRARREAEAKKEAEAKEIRKKCEEHRYWWDIKKNFEPKTPEELSVAHPLYVEACKRLPRLEEWLDQHMGR